ncbi:uncharacterized protein LOC129950713 [Eupeodes corollae]|uniref:uncharacterized protein LOC129950713 n=1 Tax=Eupeodes corollae TaxID=290404 RepID=UPI00248FBE85|nr:uncharacterized protein LOC129950713 [Eupeodes corollae]
MNLTSIRLLAFVAIVSVKFVNTVSKNVEIESFLKTIQDFYKFDSVFLLQTFDSENGFVVQKVSNLLGIPVILSSGETKSFFLKEKFTDNFLILINLTENSKNLLQRLPEYLQVMEHFKILFLLKSSSKNETELKEIFKFCWNNSIINVIAVFRDFCSSSTYYSFSNFGEFKIEEIIWQQNEVNNIELYPNRMHNLNGIILPIVFQYRKDTLYSLKTVGDEHILSGQIGNLFRTFAARHNARLNTSSLMFPLFLNDLNNLVSNKTVEISSIPTLLISSKSFSYPCFRIAVGVMLPIEAKIPVFKVFMRVFYLDAFLIAVTVVVLFSAVLETSEFLWGKNIGLLNFFMNLNLLGGILGQSLVERPTDKCCTKIIYLLIFLLGIMLTTLYGAFLQTLMTEPLKEKFIKTLEDVISSNLKIKGFSLQFGVVRLYNPEVEEIYSKAFLIKNTKVSEAIDKDQDALNTKYAYVTLDVTWKFYEYMQNFLGIKLFRWSKELCLVKSVPIGFPVYENSIYKEILKFHSLDVQASGLWEFWIKRALYENKKNGNVRSRYFEFKEKFRSMKVEDFKWIWTALSLAFLISSLCFLAEIFVFKWKKRIKRKWQSLKSYFISKFLGLIQNYALAFDTN